MSSISPINLNDSNTNNQVAHNTILFDFIDTFYRTLLNYNQKFLNNIHNRNLFKININKEIDNFIIFNDLLNDKILKININGDLVNLTGISLENYLLNEFNKFIITQKKVNFSSLGINLNNILHLYNIDNEDLVIVNELNTISPFSKIKIPEEIKINSGLTNSSEISNILNLNYLNNEKSDLCLLYNKKFNRISITINGVTFNLFNNEIRVSISNESELVVLSNIYFSSIISQQIDGVDINNFLINDNKIEFNLFPSLTTDQTIELNLSLDFSDEEIDALYNRIFAGRNYYFDNNYQYDNARLIINYKDPDNNFLTWSNDINYFLTLTNESNYLLIDNDNSFEIEIDINYDFYNLELQIFKNSIQPSIEKNLISQDKILNINFLTDKVFTLLKERKRIIIEEYDNGFIQNITEVLLHDDNKLQNNYNLISSFFVSDKIYTFWENKNSINVGSPNIYESERYFIQSTDFIQYLHDDDSVDIFQYYPLIKIRDDNNNLIKIDNLFFDNIKLIDFILIDSIPYIIGKEIGDDNNLLFFKLDFHNDIFILENDNIYLNKIYENISIYDSNDNKVSNIKKDILTNNNNLSSLITKDTGLIKYKNDLNDDFYKKYVNEIKINSNIRDYNNKVYKIINNLLLFKYINIEGYKTNLIYKFEDNFSNIDSIIINEINYLDFTVNNDYVYLTNEIDKNLIFGRIINNYLILNKDYLFTGDNQIDINYNVAQDSFIRILNIRYNNLSTEENNLIDKNIIINFRTELEFQNFNNDNYILEITRQQLNGVDIDNFNIDNYKITYNTFPNLLTDDSLEIEISTINNYSNFINNYYNYLVLDGEYTIIKQKKHTDLSINELNNIIKLQYYDIDQLIYYSNNEDIKFNEYLESKKTINQNTNKIIINEFKEDFDQVIIEEKEYLIEKNGILNNDDFNILSNNSTLEPILNFIESAGNGLVVRSLNRVFNLYIQNNYVGINGKIKYYYNNEISKEFDKNIDNLFDNDNRLRLNIEFISNNKPVFIEEFVNSDLTHDSIIPILKTKPVLFTEQIQRYIIFENNDYYYYNQSNDDLNSITKIKFIYDNTTNKITLNLIDFQTYVNNIKNNINNISLYDSTNINQNLFFKYIDNHYKDEPLKEYVNESVELSENTNIIINLNNDYYFYELKKATVNSEIYYYFNINEKALLDSIRLNNNCFSIIFSNNNGYHGLINYKINSSINNDLKLCLNQSFYDILTDNSYRIKKLGDTVLDEFLKLNLNCDKALDGEEYFFFDNDLLNDNLNVSQEIEINNDNFLLLTYNNSNLYNKIITNNNKIFIKTS